MTKTIDQLNPAAIAALTDRFEISKAGVTKFLTSQQILDLINPYRTVFKKVSQTINSQTTFVNDADVRFPVVANGIYVFTILMDITPNFPSNFKYAMSVPPGTISSWTSAQFGGFWTTATATGDTLPVTTPVIVEVNQNQPKSILNMGMLRIGGTPGEAIFRWAQEVSDPQDTILNDMTWLTYQKVN